MTCCSVDGPLAEGFATPKLYVRPVRMSFPAISELQMVWCSSRILKQASASSSKEQVRMPQNSSMLHRQYTTCQFPDSSVGKEVSLEPTSLRRTLNRSSRFPQARRWCSAWLLPKTILPAAIAPACNGQIRGWAQLSCLSARYLWMVHIPWRLLPWRSLLWMVHHDLPMQLDWSRGVLHYISWGPNQGMKLCASLTFDLWLTQSLWYTRSK